MTYTIFGQQSLYLFAFLAVFSASCQLPKLTKPYRTISHTEGLHNVFFASDSKTIIASAMEGGVIVWSTENWTQLGEISGPGPARRISMDRSSNHLSIVFEDMADVDQRVLRVYDASSKKLVFSSEPMRCLWALSAPDLGHIAWVSDDSTTVFLRDSASGVVRRLALPIDTTAVRSPAFSPDGRWFVASVTEVSGKKEMNSLVVWSVASASKVKAISLPVRSVESVFSSAGKYYAIGGKDNHVTVLQTSDWKVVVDSKVEGNRDDSDTLIGFGADEQVLYCGSWIVRPLSISTTTFGAPISLGSRPSNIAVSPDGKMIAAVYDFGDPTINIWRVRAD